MDQFWPRAVSMRQSPGETFAIAKEAIDYLQHYAASLPDWEARIAELERRLDSTDSSNH